MGVDEVPERIEHNLLQELFKMDFAEESDPFCNSAAPVLIAACQWWNVCHHMHREHPGRPTWLLQISFTLDLTFHWKFLAGSLRLDVKLILCHLIREKQVDSSSVARR